MPQLYPLMLDVTSRLILIVGGGTVAARKATGLMDAGATRIRVVSPVFSPEFPAGLERHVRRYEAADLQDADLVFAATDSTTVNNAVVADARNAGVWVSRADGSDECPGDFITPAKFQRGPIFVTVSAGSAALTTRVRDGLAERFDPAWIAMADAMQRVRPLVLASELDAIARRDLFRELAGDEAMNILKTGGVNALIEWLTPKLG